MQAPFLWETNVKLTYNIIYNHDNYVAQTERERDEIKKTLDIKFWNYRSGTVNLESQYLIPQLSRREIWEQEESTANAENY